MLCFSVTKILIFENVKQYFADISILANDICQEVDLTRCHKASLHLESLVFILQLSFPLLLGIKKLPL